MSYAVIHMEKGSGSTGGMQGHNERSYDVKNADPDRGHLNFFVSHKEGKIVTSSKNPRMGSYKSREDDIIEKRTIRRKIQHNAVRRLNFVLSGSHKRMKELEKMGQIENWAKANYQFMAKKYGAENITEFAVHLDERTAHIHCMIVPIVKTEKGTKLCARDLTSRDQLKDLQTEYGEAMKPFGLNRGLEGSRATHDSVKEYYAKIESEKGELEEVRIQKHELYQERNEAREKYLHIEEINVKNLRGIRALLRAKELGEEANRLEKKSSNIKEKYRGPSI